MCVCVCVCVSMYSYLLGAAEHTHRAGTQANKQQLRTDSGQQRRAKRDASNANLARTRTFSPGRTGDWCDLKAMGV